MDENATSELPADPQPPVPPPTDSQASDVHPLESLRPQLRLHHLFALTAVAAVLLAINGPQPDYWSNAQYQPPKFMLTLFTAIGVLSVMLISVAVTGVAYGIAWQRRGLKFFDQPGHWLLVEVGTIGLFSLVPTIVYRWLFSEMKVGSPDFPVAAMIVVGVYSLLLLFAFPLAFNIYIGLKKCRETRWSLVFYLKAVANFLFGIGHVVVIVLLIFAAKRDRRDGVTRDPSHWCGVWLQLAQCVLYCISGGIGIANMFYIMSHI